jgi:ATP-binding cassette subfamily A (ABC1) protein 5
MNDFRMMLGVCPQHDILFDLLTPVEHLRLFDLLKVQMSQK